jgi:predicted nucleic acid-binding protein
MLAPVFVDTNVLIYARDEREALKRPIANLWLEKLWAEQSLRTSMQVLSEYYYNVTRKTKPAISADAAWEQVESLLGLNPHPTDGHLLERGHVIERRYQLSWWDSLIVAAAQLQSCALLLTEDLQDGAQFGDVRVCNPFKHKVSEALASYRVDLPQVAPLHRPRGRPRKAA